MQEIEHNPKNDAQFVYNQQMSIYDSFMTGYISDGLLTNQDGQIV